MTTTKVQAYPAQSATSALAPLGIARREPGPLDVEIEVLYCGVCHSDLHQARNEWHNTIYPCVPGHEIVGRVTRVGSRVTKFRSGDLSAVGCMVDSCRTCENCRAGFEQYCLSFPTFTYNSDDKYLGGPTFGGYSTNQLPKTISLQDAAPLLCAGITTYSHLVKASIKKGYKVGVAGIGGLGHLAIKLAVAKGAEVYAFTTSESKVNDIRRFGAKEVIVVDSVEKLKAYNKSLDYMISTIPLNHDVAAYASLVKPYGNYTQVGMPAKGEVTINNFAFNRNRVRYSTSLIGGVPQTQEVIDYCAKKKIYPEVQVIKASEANDTWEKVINKEARYRYVIDAATI